MIARDTSHPDEDAGVERDRIVADVVRASTPINASNCINVAGEFFHFTLLPTHFTCRPRCRPLAEPLEPSDIIDNANHGLIRNEVSAPRRHGRTSNDAGGTVDGEQPLELSTQAQPVASLDEGQHSVAERKGLQERLALGRRLLALALGRRRRGRDCSFAESRPPGNAATILRRADATCHAFAASVSTSPFSIAEATK